MSDDLTDVLADVVKANPKKKDATTIFIGLPNMSTLNTGLVTKLFAWARNPNIMPWYHFVTEKRHADHARNSIAQEFMDSKCEFLAMIDADTDPHTDFIDLYKHNKDIIAATVDCWINNELIPSVWQKAECEQCRVIKKFVETGENQDPSQYRIDGEYLERWIPEGGFYSGIADRKAILTNRTCRCGGTGFDPFVFRTYNKDFKSGELIQVDSVGTAAIMIHRRVFENMPQPWFRFYYKHYGEIMLTEDHYFCWKAEILGFTIWADLNMQCSHFKTIDLAGVKQRIIKAFEAGMDYQKKRTPEDEIAKHGIIVPPTADEVSRIHLVKN